MSRREHRRAEDERYRVWKGGYRPYDLVKEASIALGVVLALAVVLTVLFSSPDEKPSTVKSWATSMPLDFVTTATTELDGSSGTGSYGPPYNHANGSTQHAWFLHPERWLGVSHPINTAQDFVLAPLRSITGQPAVEAAVTQYESASSSQQSSWTTAYEKGLGDKNANATASGTISVPNGNYGPLPAMMTGLLQFAQSGGLDGALLTSQQFYQTDYTKPLMFMADGGLLAARAQSEHLLGDQWGMMNETGSYPGQVWLWLYTFWYQIKPFQGGNADLLVMLMMGALSLAFVLVPFLPGVRDIPRRIPVYKLIWRDHYRSLGGPPPASTPSASP
jgi:hypothetical protein